MTQRDLAPYRCDATAHSIDAGARYLLSKLADPGPTFFFQCGMPGPLSTMDKYNFSELTPTLPYHITLSMKWLHSSTDPRYQGTYQSWSDMRKRCTNPQNPKYPIYGGRGITVCERWLNNFDAFIIDMGIRPDNLTIERIDVDGNYDPFNCTWATRKENNNNTRKAIAKRQRILENPPMEDWERTALREIRKPVKPPYVPQEPVHGSKRMYHKHKCRCEVCVASFRERVRRKGRNKSDEAKAKKAAWLRDYRRRKRNGG